MKEQNQLGNCQNRLDTIFPGNKDKNNIRHPNTIILEIIINIISDDM